LLHSDRGRHGLGCWGRLSALLASSAAVRPTVAMTDIAYTWCPAVVVWPSVPRHVRTRQRNRSVAVGPSCPRVVGASLARLWLQPREPRAPGPLRSCLAVGSHLPHVPHHQEPFALLAGTAAASAVTRGQVSGGPRRRGK